MENLRALAIVHIVSHGPYCLDGVAAAVAVARYHSGATSSRTFPGTNALMRCMRAIGPEAAPAGSELWITDISWTEKETDNHISTTCGTRSKDFLVRPPSHGDETPCGRDINVPFTDHVVSEEFSASRLIYEYLEKQLAEAKEQNYHFNDFAQSRCHG